MLVLVSVWDEKIGEPSLRTLNKLLDLNISTQNLIDLFERFIETTDFEAEIERDDRMKNGGKCE